jgi:murein L,D-transpeptidase YcbB/YkuD
MPGLRRFASVAIVLWLVFTSGDRQRPFAYQVTVTPPPSVAAAIRAIVETRTGRLTEPLSLWEQQQLTALYAPGDYLPLWTDAVGRVNSDARDALALLNAATNDGLDPLDYAAPRLQKSAAGLAAAFVAPVDDIAVFDVSLSANMLRYFQHLHFGRVDPRAMGYRMPPRERDDLAGLLRVAVVEHALSEAASELNPSIPLYRQLRSALARYRTLAADPELTAFQPPRATLRPGERWEGLPQLYRLLVALGDLAAAESDRADLMLYDGAVVDGVRHFQMRHGLDIDGVLGKTTRAALTVPLSWRVRQLEIALERMRWLPHLDRDRLVVVNIPMFRLRAVNGPAGAGVSSFSSPVIVGRALHTRTPVLVEEMEYVIFRPYWNVPSSIVRQEILPAIRRTPGYLQRHDMEIVSGQPDSAPVVPSTDANLARLRDGTLRLRQRPGPKNSLGLVKFVFPNDSNVYLHGTPAMELFSHARRDFSHGCMRVADPVGFAEWVLAEQPGWDREAIQAAMNAPASRRVDLPHPIQVIVFYLTAALTIDEGSVQFAEDIYSHDARLDQYLTWRSGS